MAKFDVAGSFKTDEFFNMDFNASTTDEAEQLAREYVSATFPEAFDVEIDTIKEIVD